MITGYLKFMKTDQLARLDLTTSEMRRLSGDLIKVPYLRSSKDMMILAITFLVEIQAYLT